MRKTLLLTVLCMVLGIVAYGLAVVTFNRPEVTVYGGIALVVLLAEVLNDYIVIKKIKEIES